MQKGKVLVKMLGCINAGPPVAQWDKRWSHNARAILLESPLASTYRFSGGRRIVSLPRILLHGV